MISHLVFHLWGPMQSWGGVGAVGEIRGGGERPTKSALIGLLSAALGYERGDPRIIELQHQLHFAVHVMSLGHNFRDFHTVQTPQKERKADWQTRAQELQKAKKLNTIVSRRDYRSDACFAIALWPADDTVDMQNLAAAIKQPTFGFYLGRRSCPLGLPLSFHLIAASDPLAAFAQALAEDQNADPQSQQRRRWLQQIAYTLRIPKAVMRAQAGEVYSDVQLQAPAKRIQSRRDQRIAHPQRRFVARNEYVYQLNAPEEE